MYGFFFSSRRRHTRCLSDWSSDVCSSDLLRLSGATGGDQTEAGLRTSDPHGLGRGAGCDFRPACIDEGIWQAVFGGVTEVRSEERRVGKVCRYWWVADK